MAKIPSESATSRSGLFLSAPMVLIRHSVIGSGHGTP